MKKRQDPRGRRASFWRSNLVLGALMFLPVAWAQKTAPEESPDEMLQHTVVALPLEKVGRWIQDPDSAAIKWGRVAMFDPKLANQLREARKTPAQKAAEELAALAMLEPEKYRRLREQNGPKTKEEPEQAKERAIRAILKPREVAEELEKLKDPATRRREKTAEQAILFPREFNAFVQRHKSPELQAREAQVIEAWSRPREFLEERLRLQKNEGKKEGPAQEPQGKRAPDPTLKEKGQGGGQ